MVTMDEEAHLRAKD